MTASVLLSIETNGAIDSHHIQLDLSAAERLRATLVSCPGLMPAEAAGRLASVIQSFEGVTVTKIETFALPLNEAAGEQTLRPLDPPKDPDPLAEIPVTPAAVPVEDQGAPV